MSRSVNKPSVQVFDRRRSKGAATFRPRPGAPPVHILIEYIHVLQIERGSTSTWIASATNAAGVQAAAGVPAVAEGRAATDVVLAEYADWRPKKQTLASELSLLRGSANLFRHPVLTAGAAADARTFFSVMSGYAALIELLCKYVDIQLRYGRHAALLRSLVRFKEAMAFERGFLCSTLALPDRLFQLLPSTASDDLALYVQMQMQLATVLEAMLNTKPLIESTQTLVLASITLLTELRDIQEQVVSESGLARLRDSLSASECWGIFTAHIEKTRHAELALTAKVTQSMRNRGAVRALFFRLLERFRGNLDVDVKTFQSISANSTLAAGSLPQSHGRRM